MEGWIKQRYRLLAVGDNVDSNSYQRAKWIPGNLGKSRVENEWSNRFHISIPKQVFVDNSRGRVNVCIFVISN